MLKPCSKLISGPSQYWVPVVSTCNLSCWLFDLGVPLCVTSQDCSLASKSQKPFLKSFLFSSSQQGIESQWICQLSTKGKRKLKQDMNTYWWQISAVFIVTPPPKKIKKNMLFYINTYTTALLPVHACVCFLIFVLTLLVVQRPGPPPSRPELTPSPDQSHNPFGGKNSGSDANTELTATTPQVRLIYSNSEVKIPGLLFCIPNFCISCLTIFTTVQHSGTFGFYQKIFVICLMIWWLNDFLNSLMEFSFKW